MRDHVNSRAHDGLAAIYTDRGRTADDAQVFVCGIVRALQAEIEASP